MFDKLFNHVFWTVFKLGSLLKEGLCPQGTGPFGILRGWRGRFRDMVTPYGPDAPGALHDKSVSIGLSYHV